MSSELFCTFLQCSRYRGLRTFSITQYMVILIQLGRGLKCSLGEFEVVFTMDREAFAALPAWKKAHLKKSKNLFQSFIKCFCICTRICDQMCLWSFIRDIQYFLFIPIVLFLPFGITSRHFLKRHPYHKKLFFYENQCPILLVFIKIAGFTNGHQ